MANKNINLMEKVVNLAKRRPVQLLSVKPIP